MQVRNNLKEHFQFCPSCGNAQPCIIEDRELNCKVCGFRFFFNIAAAAGAFIMKGNALVLCIRGKEPGQGKLDVPGGFIEFDETLEDGLRREILEELGIQVDNLTYLTSAPNDYRFAGVPYKTSDVFFRATIAEDVVLIPQDDVADFICCDPFKVDANNFAFESTRRGYYRLLDSLALSQDPSFELR